MHYISSELFILITIISVGLKNLGIGFELFTAPVLIINLSSYIPAVYLGNKP